MTPRDFERELRAEEAARATAGVPAAARHAVWERLSGGARPRPRASTWVGAGAALALVALLLFVWRPWRPRELGGMGVVLRTADARPAVSADGRVSVEEGALTLREPQQALTLALSAHSTVQRSAAGLHVWRGRVLVTAQHRAHGSTPATVLVSGGAIEVMGTRFIVDQEDGRGEVALLDGQIRFRASDGRVVVLAPGERLRWPLPAPPPVEPAPEPAPAPVRPSGEANAPGTSYASGDALLREVEILRGRHEFARAAHLLTEVSPGWPASTRERLSFELGALYTHQLGDRSRACAQWRSHRIDFPRGHYDADVRRAQRELGCSGRGGR